MITKFKAYEAYSGAGKAIGFRYSNPASDEINHYKSVIVTDSIPSKELRKNLTAAIESLDVDGQYEIEDDIITIDFYSFSLGEASKIHEELLEFVKSSGYKVVDTFLSTPKGLGIKRKPGFRVSREIPQNDPPETTSTKLGFGASAAQIPKPEEKEKERPVIGFKNYNK